MTKNHPFKIVVAGEDFGAVLRAQALTTQLAAGLKPEFEISNEVWKFESLDNLQMGKEAADGAAKADMVIIAGDGAAEPPTHIKSWIESWLPRKRKGLTALFALLDHEDNAPHESSPLYAYLRRTARKWGMKFLTNSADGWQRNFGFPAEASA